MPPAYPFAGTSREATALTCKIAGRVALHYRNAFSGVQARTERPPLRRAGRPGRSYWNKFGSWSPSGNDTMDLISATQKPMLLQVGRCLTEPIRTAADRPNGSQFVGPAESSRICSLDPHAGFQGTFLAVDQGRKSACKHCAIRNALRPYRTSVLTVNRGEAFYRKALRK
jgi:hypothetical protein